MYVGYAGVAAYAVGGGRKGRKGVKRAKRQGVVCSVTGYADGFGQDESTAT